ncbi:putative hydrolase [Salana multivorans]|uniref:Putative hydrolase n=1 Tax=Salana multivorans TaxID=120377 RepID=A0A3N2D857_9MICO|nr:putative hydrolase [Salana multivorans]
MTDESVQPAFHGPPGSARADGPDAGAWTASAGTSVAPAVPVVAALREIAFWRERARTDPHRVMAYRNAADLVAGLSGDEIAALGTVQAAWKRLPGIGASTAAAICSALAGTVPGALVEARAEARELLPDDDAASRALAARLRGDLHAHSHASDGSASIAEMAAVARALGREYQAITDHSPRLRVANGLSADRLRAQLDEVTALNAAFAAEGADFRVLTGIEVDILPDGTLDQDEALLLRVDVVVASVHSELRMEREAMTVRMVAAAANPRVDVLGHCTGRLVEGERGVRPPSEFDAEVVFEACAQFGTAVEISSRPERRDPPLDLLRLAVEADCLFSIDSDAHAPGQLAWLPWGAQRAVAGGVDPDRIVTTWSRDRLLAWSRGE